MPVINSVADSSLTASGVTSFPAPAINATSGSAILVFVGGLTTTFSVDDSGGVNVYNPLTAQDRPDTAVEGQWFIAENIVGDPALIVSAHYAPAGGFPAIFVYEISGIVLIGAVDVDNKGANGTGTAITSQVYSTSQPDEILFAGYGGFGFPLFIPEAGYTSLDDPNRQYQTAYKAVSSSQVGITTTATRSDSQQWLIAVVTLKVAAVSIICDNPPDGIVGDPYSHFFPASGGAAPYSFAITAGALPDGLSIDAGTGEVSGTPTLAGTFTFTVQVTDANAATADVECSITIGAALAITCGSPPSGVVGSPYNHQIPATGGLPPYTFAITLGALPDGLALDPATGLVSGTPTAAGDFTFTVEVTDSADNTADVECTITIDPAQLNLSCDNPPTGHVGVAYSHTFPATGGTPPYTFGLIDGELPPGLTLDAGTGTVSGTPTTKGVYSFTLRVVDSDDAMADVECSITITGKCLVD